MSVKMCVWKCCCSVMLPGLLPNASRPILPPTCRVGFWIWTTVHQWKILQHFNQNNQTNDNLSDQVEVQTEKWWCEKTGFRQKEEMKVQLLTSSYFKRKSHTSWDYSGYNFGLKNELTHQKSNWFSFSFEYRLKCKIKKIMFLDSYSWIFNFMF